MSLFAIGQAVSLRRGTTSEFLQICLLIELLFVFPVYSNNIWMPFNSSVSYKDRAIGATTTAGKEELFPVV